MARAQPTRASSNYIVILNPIQASDLDYRGDWKMESTFSPASLYFFSTLFFCCFSSSPFVAGVTMLPLIVSPPRSPLRE